MSVPRTVRPTPGILPCFLLAAVCALPVRAQEWPSRWALNFVVEGADPQLAHQTVAVLGPCSRELAASSGVALPDTVFITYVGLAQSFDSVVGGRFPDWGAACAISDRRLIAVRSPRDYPTGRSLGEILRHELAHLHLDALTGQRQVPRWMQEGYAQQIAHQWQFGDDWIVARAVFTDRLIPLRRIDGVNSFRDASARLAYAESYLAMGHFLQAYGWDGLLIFAERIRRDRDWDAAFFAATGLRYAGFQDEFNGFVRGKYNWISFLGDTALLWIGLVIVFLVLYLIRRRRDAARLADWQRQEAIEDVFYSPFNRSSSDPDAPKREE